MGRLNFTEVMAEYVPWFEESPKNTGFLEQEVSSGLVSIGVSHYIAFAEGSKPKEQSMLDTK